jgi:hypothetical protein
LEEQSEQWSLVPVIPSGNPDQKVHLFNLIPTLRIITEAQNSAVIQRLIASHPGWA